MTVHRLLRRAAAPAAIAALALTGCSSTPSAAPPGPSTPPAGSTAPTDSAAPSTPDATATLGSPTLPESSSTAPAGTATSSSGATTAPAPRRCTTATLSGAIRPLDSAAGNRYAEIVLTNRGEGTCVINGYGGVGLLGAGGRALPSRQDRDTSVPGAPVTLRPGATAMSRLHWGAVNSVGDSQTGQCQPTPTTLTVIPPDERTALRIAWTLGPVCDRGRLEQQAYRAG
jgi:Protein of unknown function (DUF4232)